MKNCTKCGLFKGLEQFYLGKAFKDGHQPWCKVCMRLVTAEWARRNPEKIKQIRARTRATPQGKEYDHAYRRAWYAKNKEKSLAARKTWRAANLESEKAKKRAYYYANKEAMRIHHKTWVRSHREKIREIAAASVAKRRAAKYGSGGSWTEKDVRAMFTLQRGMCAVCKCKLDKSFHRDHIVALASGGSNDKLNLQLLCKFCNCRKHKKDPIKFMQENGYLL